jgi:hypothetical protein
MDREDQQAIVYILCFVNAAVYFAALLYLGATGWRAAIVASVVLVAALTGFGRTILLRGGVIIIVLSVWAGVSPHAWTALAAG